KTWNVGLDYGFLDNRFTGSIEYYHTINEGLLTQRKLPDATGFSVIWQNIGEGLHSVLEMSLTSRLISKTDFDWAVTGMVSRNKNKITGLTEGRDDRSNVWFIGHPIGVVWDFKKTGIWQVDEVEEAKLYNMQPGEIKLVDRDNDFAFTDE